MHNYVETVQYKVPLSKPQWEKWNYDRKSSTFDTKFIDYKKNYDTTIDPFWDIIWTCTMFVSKIRCDFFKKLFQQKMYTLMATKVKTLIEILLIQNSLIKKKCDNPIDPFRLSKCFGTYQVRKIQRSQTVKLNMER